MPGPVDGGVHDLEPRESKDNVFLVTAHDVEEMFLDDPFNVCIEGVGIADCTSFICGLVYILECNGGGKFLGGEQMFPDKLPVNARDIHTRVY